MATFDAYQTIDFRSLTGLEILNDPSTLYSSVASTIYNAVLGTTQVSMIGSGFVTQNGALIDGNIAHLSVAMDGYGAYAMSFSLNNVDLSNLKGMIEAAPAGDLTGVLEWLLGGRDFIDAAAGNHNDWIRGFAGNDEIWGYGGNDVLKGDAGDDTLWGGKGADKLNGGSGVDTAVYADFTKPVAVTLDGPNYSTVVVGGVKQDKIKNIENVRGGEAADTLAGDGADNILFGNRGDDRLSGHSGNDTLQGEDGNDTLIGGKGADDLIGGSGRDTMTGGKGADVFSFVEPPDSTKMDIITDFQPGKDVIRLDRFSFPTPATGPLDPEYFAVGSATDDNDFFIYKNGKLFYDSDGNGAISSPVLFLKLSGAPALTADDLYILP